MAHSSTSTSMTALLLCLALWCLPLHAESSSPVVGEPIELNFPNNDIVEIARTLAVWSGRNVVVDPRVKGKLTLVSDTPVKATQAIAQFASALRMRDYALIDSAGMLKVVPEAEAKLQTTRVNVRSPRLAPSNQVVTQIFQVQHENANNLVPVLRPLISPNNTINVSGNNALIITDYAENLVRIEEIINTLDVDDGFNVTTIRLQNSVASDVASILKTLLSAPTSARKTSKTAATNDDATILADPSSNTLIISAATSTRLDQIRNLIRQLDVAPHVSGDIHVVHLKNAKASDLATTLRAALGASTSTTASSSAASASSKVQASATSVSSGGMIQADESTNSLIITAPAHQMRQLRSVIEQLDGRRAQVFVESLIAEVSADKAAEFGIQWQGAIGNSGDSVIGLLGTNFGSGGSNILNLAVGAASGSVTPASGMNIGGLSRQRNGAYALGFLGRFLQENGDANILSTPTLLTLDNQEAKIVIGQNVPFVTGQYTSSSGSSTVNPFQTIERKDVGLTLRVKPQISENGVIKMDIFQEVSNVSDTSTAGLITNKRSIESSVLVDDGQIVVLGGLLQDTYSNSNQAVPGLAELPGIGQLFRSDSRTRKKTNLMVFLRPVIVRDARASERLSISRYDLMRSQMQNAQPEPSKVLPVNESPVLPPVRSIELTQ